MKQIIRALFVLASVVMVVAAPVASAAAMSEALCGQHLAKGSPHEAQGLDGLHMGHGQTTHGHGSHPDQNTEGAGDTDPIFTCCDQACFVELPVLTTSALAVIRTTAARHSWSSDNLTDVSRPDGLHRPPKG